MPSPTPLREPAGAGGPEAVLRHQPVRFQADVVRQLPRPQQSLRPPTNTQPVQLGGPNLTTPGFRAVPTLTYKDFTPTYC